MKLRNWSQNAIDSIAWNDLVQGTKEPCRLLCQKKVKEEVGLRFVKSSEGGWTSMLQGMTLGSRLEIL
jgi:hypothetical protein